MDLRQRKGDDASHKEPSVRKQSSSKCETGSRLWLRGWTRANSPAKFCGKNSYFCTESVVDFGPRPNGSNFGGRGG
jgi:hypothetical protein